MITKGRKADLLDLWEHETSEDWTQEWRDDLNKEEMALVDQWDEQYDFGVRRMYLDILQRLNERGTQK